MVDGVLVGEAVVDLLFFFLFETIRWWGRYFLMECTRVSCFYSGGGTVYGWSVAMSGAGTGLISITHRLFTGVNIRGAAVGSVTLTSGGNEEALCACFGDGRSVCLTIIRSRLSVLSSVVGRIMRGSVRPSRGLVRVVCARLSTMGRIIFQGNALHTGFFQSV